MPIAPSDVAVAACGGKAASRIRRGTATIPPPTPNSALKKPATRPIAMSRTAVSYGGGRDLPAGAARRGTGAERRPAGRRRRARADRGGPARGGRAGGDARGAGPAERPLRARRL